MISSPTEFLSNLKSFTHPSAVKTLGSRGAEKTSGSEDNTKAMAQLQERLMQQLAKRIPGMEVADLKALDPADFTPEAIAERVTQFVGQGLESARQQGRSEQEVQSLYDNAVRGMEEGLTEAKDILAGLNLLQGKIAEDVEKTAGLLRDSLAELDPSRQREAIARRSGRAALSMAERYQSASTFELQMRTQEGDEVTIRFGQRQDISASAAAYADSDGNRAAMFALSRSEEMGFSFSIEGDLNDEEMTALQDLTRDVSRMADDFFGGDMQKAFDQVDALRFDTSQLASFEVNMSQTQQYTAARAYRETQQIERPEAEQRPGLRLGQLMNEMRERFNQAALSFLEQPEAAGVSLMRALVEQDARMREADSDKREPLQANLDTLLGARSAEPQAA